MTRAVLLAALVLAGCPKRPPGDGADTDLPADSDSDLPADSDSDLPTDSDTAAPGSCAAAEKSLANELYATLGGCTATVRVDFERTRILGYQLRCGPYARTSEAAARAAAFAETGWATSADAGTVLDAAPEDQWVLYQSPGDFGGAAAVSARTGQPVFGGTIVWDGHGDLTFPPTWRAPSTLGAGCDGAAPPTSRGWDLRSGTALASPDVDAALALVRDTALPAAFQRGGYLFDAVVLLYPRSVGAFDPASAEWIVLLDGGWLE